MKLKIATGFLVLQSLLLTVAKAQHSTEELVKKLSPAVVVLEVRGAEYTQSSGVIIGNGRTIITNHHSVAGASSVIVHTMDGQELIATGYLVDDEDRDLVTIQIPHAVHGITPVSLGYLDNINIGQKVVAIGSPQGLTNTVSEGIISGVREFEEGTSVIQTTAPVSPGSSGGGLFNSAGELIGITSFLRTGGQNLNFAYPSDYILPLMTDTTPKPFSTLNSVPLVVRDENIIVYVTQSGKKYHRENCRYLKKSRIKMTLDEAIERGYSPGSVCKAPR